MRVADEAHERIVFPARLDKRMCGVPHRVNEPGVGWLRHRLQRPGGRSLRARQQLMDLGVGDLAEIFIPESDGKESFGRFGADDLVHLTGQFPAGARGADGHGHDDPIGVLNLEGGDRGAHRGTCREPVVHKDDDPAGHAGRRTTVAVSLFAALEFPLLVRRDPLDCRLRDPVRLHHVLVQHADAAGRDRAHRKFFVTGYAELTDEKDVERKFEGAGNLVPDRNAAAREREHNGIRPSTVSGKSFCQNPAGIGAVPEHCGHLRAGPLHPCLRRRPGGGGGYRFHDNPTAYNPQRTTGCIHRARYISCLLKPQSPQELAEAVGCAAARRQTIRLGGRFSKDAIGGPIHESDVTISTAALGRVLEYDPRDLTVSAGAGMKWSELSRILGGNRQMIPLDPPFAESTVGGVVASNLSGPRRRLYGTARDVIIGMKFATVEGKLVESGGMVVKNVAGLDTAKLMIGSLGTLAAIAVVNFKLAPMPTHSRTLLLSFESAGEAFAARDRILRGVLQPAALDVLNHAAAAAIGRVGYVIAVQAGGNQAVVDRYNRDLPQAAAIEGADEAALWTAIGGFPPGFLAENPDGAVVRFSTVLTGMRPIFERIAAPVIGRAGSGVVYAFFDDWRSAQEAACEGNAVVEFAPPARKADMNLWPSPGTGFELMRRVKQLFDPGHLLNRGRLYGRL